MISFCLKTVFLLLISLLAACGGGGGADSANNGDHSSDGLSSGGVSSPSDSLPPPTSPDSSGSPNNPVESDAPSSPGESTPPQDPQPPQQSGELEGIYLLAGRPNERGHIDGQGAEARFNGIGQLEIDGEDNLYLVDAGTIRRISPDGIVTTLAGVPGEYGYQDGVGQTARFGQQIEIAVGPPGVIYVLDNPYIRKLAPTGEVTTIAEATEQGMEDGPIENARFHKLRSIGADDEGNIYVEDAGSGWNSFAARKISPDGVVSTVYTACAETLYRGCFDLKVDPRGTLYFKDKPIAQSAGGVQTIGAPLGSKVTLEGLVSGIRGYPVGMDALTKVTVADIDRHGNVFVYHTRREGELYAWYSSWRITRTDHYLKKLSPSGEVTIIEPFTREQGETPPPFTNPNSLPLSAHNHSSLAVDSKGVIHYAGTGFIGKVVTPH